MGELSYSDLRAILLDRERDAESKDTLLLALVRQARLDPEAAACVTACLYPGLSRIVRRWAPTLGHDEAWAAGVGALCRRLTTFDLLRRRRFVALHLMRGTSRDLRAVSQREQAWYERTQLGGEITVEQLTAPADDGVDDPLGTDRRLTKLDAALIRATRLGGLSLTDVAKLLGLSYEATKKRRQRAEAIWACAHAPALQGARPSLPDRDAAA